MSFARYWASLWRYVAICVVCLAVNDAGIYAEEPASDSRTSLEIPCEGAIPAVQVKAGTVVLQYNAVRPATLTGFYARLTNCIGPRRKPTVIGLRIGNELTSEQVAIPFYGEPLNLYTRIGVGAKTYPPLDVGQEYRIALAKPIQLKPGDSVAIEVVSSETLSSGVTAGLQFAGTWPLADMREPFRVTKGAGQ